MCDVVAGELLMSFHKRDVAGQSLLEAILTHRIEHVEVIGRLDEDLFKMGLLPRAGLDLLFCRLRVPIGQESFKVNYLQFFYKHHLLNAISAGRMTAQDHADVLGRSDFHLQVVPHSRLSVAATGSSIRFQFDPVHSQYRNMLNTAAIAGTGRDRSIAVLDSGIERGSSLGILQERNFVDPSQKTADDDYGHGTAVAEIIHDLCPDSPLVVYKVVDSQGTANEWDTLAALAAQSPAHVVNMSLAFGLTSVTCPTCGRHPQQSRSAIFENLVNQVVNGPGAPLLVAAAGNAAASELAYPARFGNVVAVTSVNSSCHLSSFSNRSTADATGQKHPNVFAAPGGDDATVKESVGSSIINNRHFGTSYAAAYATGLAAKVWSTPPYASLSSSGLIDHLKKHSDANFTWYDPNLYGNGVLRA